MAASSLRGWAARLTSAVFMIAAVPVAASATDDGYTAEQLDRARDIVTGMHPDQRGALYRRAADAKLTAEEQFLNEEAPAALSLQSLATSGGISAAPNIPAPGAGADTTFGGISTMPNIPDDPPAPARGKRRR